MGESGPARLKRTWAVPAVVALISTVALGQVLAPSAASERAPAPALFAGQKLAWGSCAAFPTAPPADGSSAFECAFLRVPLDHADPTGPVVRIGLLRAPAADSDRRIGSLVMNPGGPGLSGMAAAADLAGQASAVELARRFDIVGFDPRGIGSSPPLVECQPAPDRDAERAADLAADTSPVGVARLQAQERADNSSCADVTGVEVLAHVGTRDVAQDLEILRSALGDDQLTYLGYSYGTRIGTAYAEAFPDRVRAMVLDGAIDPGQDAAGRIVDQAAAVQREFATYAADCAQHASCPVGDDPTDTVAAFRSLVRPLLDGPVPTADGRTLTYGDVSSGVGAALLDRATWPTLTAGLRELAAGRGDILMAQADVAAGRAADGSYDPVIDAGQAVLCVDDPPVTDPALAREINAQVRAAAPIFDSGRGPSPALDRCAFWPAPPTGGPHSPTVSGLPELLVVSTVGDPVTAYRSGVNLAAHLGARLLTYGGAQHTVFGQGVDCVDRAGVEYLVTLALPSAGTRCSG